MMPLPTASRVGGAGHVLNRSELQMSSGAANRRSATRALRRSPGTTFAQSIAISAGRARSTRGARVWLVDARRAVEAARAGVPATCFATGGGRRAGTIRGVSAKAVVRARARGRAARRRSALCGIRIRSIGFDSYAKRLRCVAFFRRGPRGAAWRGVTALNVRRVSAAETPRVALVCRVERRTTVRVAIRDGATREQ